MRACAVLLLALVGCATVRPAPLPEIPSYSLGRAWDAEAPPRNGVTAWPMKHLLAASTAAVPVGAGLQRSILSGLPGSGFGSLSAPVFGSVVNLPDLGFLQWNGSSDYAIQGSTSAQSMIFRVAGAERFRIDSTDGRLETNLGYHSSIAAGSTGLSFANSGAWLDLGGGANDRLKSNGTEVEFGDAILVPSSVNAGVISGLATLSVGVRGRDANDASAVAVKLYNQTALTTAGGRIVEFHSDELIGAAEAYVDIGGKFVRELGDEPIEYQLCGPGNTAAGVCHTWTNAPAAFTEVANTASRDNIDLEPFREFRIVALVSVAAVAGDIEIQCDADVAFGSAAVLGQLTNPTAALNVGAWTALPANECVTDNGVYVRAGLINGNTTEDPEARKILLQLR